MEFISQIQEFISSVPKPVVFLVVILFVVGVFFIYKRMSGKEDVETSPQNEEPLLSSAVTPSYTQEIQKGLEDLEITDDVTPPAVFDDVEPADDGDFE